MSRRRNSCSNLYVWLLILSLSCVEDNSKQEKGFVLFIDPNYWYYVPATELDGENYLDQFRSDNLGYGIQFRPFFKGRNYILENLDTVPIDNIRSEYAPNLSSLKITPVKVKYEVAAEKIPSSSIFKFSCKIRGTEVVFKFNTLQMKIKSIDPI